jgi:hypothetical protein
VLSALKLRTLKPDVERGFGEPMTKAVISVPAYLSDAGRRGAGRSVGPVGDTKGTYPLEHHGVHIPYAVYAAAVANQLDSSARRPGS